MGKGDFLWSGVRESNPPMQLGKLSDVIFLPSQYMGETQCFR